MQKRSRYERRWALRLRLSIAAMAIRDLPRASLMDRENKSLLKVLLDGESKDGQDNGQPNGRYATDFTLGHNTFEFLLDFYQSYAEDKPALLHTRVITTPV